MSLPPPLYGLDLGSGAMCGDAGCASFVWGKSLGGTRGGVPLVYGTQHGFGQPRKHANGCLGYLVPLIVINTLVIVYELVLG